MTTKENLVVSSKNYADDGTYSIHPGWWLDAQPITNLKDSDPQRFAITNGLDPAGTNFLIDLGQVQMIGLVGIINHNGSSDGRWRILFSEDGETTDLDTGELDLWPVVEQFGTLPWGVFNWGGVLPPETAQKYPINSFFLPDESILTRYIKVYLIDPTNDDGELRIGRFWAGPIWQAGVNAQYPISYSWEDTSTVTYSRGRKAYVDIAEKRRVIRFTVSYLPEAEMMGQVFDDLDRGSGIAGDCVVIPKPTVIEQMHRQAIYGRQRAIGEITETFTDQFSREFIFEENI
jgi:hypothetical protein